MKRGMIVLMVLLAVFLQGPIANAMETSQSIRLVSGPIDPLPPKPLPPSPSPGPTEPKLPNQILPRA